MITKLDTLNKVNDYNNKYNNLKGYSLYKLYANWCGHCKTMETEWNNFLIENKNLLKNINVVEIESSLLKKVKNEKLNVDSFPSILLMKNNNLVSKFNNYRTKENFKNFVINNTIKQMGGNRKIKKGGSSLLLNELQQLLVPAVLLATRSLVKNKSINCKLFDNKSFRKMFNTDIVTSIKNTFKKGKNVVKNTTHNVSNKIRTIKKNSLKKNINRTFKKTTKTLKNIKNEGKRGIKKMFSTNKLL